MVVCGASGRAIGTKTDEIYTKANRFYIKHEGFYTKSALLRPTRPHHTDSNCTWPCHRQRLVGLTGTASSVIGSGSWEVLPTAQLSDTLPLVWSELSPNVENPVVIPSTDGKEYLSKLHVVTSNLPQMGRRRGRSMRDAYDRPNFMVWSLATINQVYS